eukprot:CAMPEP_0172811572 /NCGR_PEP_ID=MMETSP1075-20121228/9503_1 /TAXON_ID=2916 /ORGANISM="Ceratium fusus, Strain PA161109" /LENGTH=284 /DNA_ID=CAMNT_0013651017 /DNA_START=62 /DNA_END=913 /DNA_ORIENTATION=-
MTLPLDPATLSQEVSLEATQKAAACAGAAKEGRLAVILDFDRTVTGGSSNSSHGVLESAGVLSELFRSKSRGLFEKYYPVEIDATLSLEDKIPIMTEWYTQVHNLMLHEDITRSKLQAAVAECRSIELRCRMQELLLRCQEASPPVPVVIMSAGLGDVIEIFLQQALPFELAPTTMVVSNRMNFDEGGRLVAFSEPLLHMFNKSAAFLPPSVQELLDSRSHCLLVGDSDGDATMTNGLNVDTLKVGLLNHKVEERMDRFRELYDVVVTDDGPVPDICFQAVGCE